MAGVGPVPGSAFGPYEVVSELGRGGMGRVLKARHVVLDRLVALKLLDEELAGDRYFLERFTKEARAAARLNHPNIVQIYDFGVVEGIPFLAMEFVEGDNLMQVLNLRGHFSEQDALQVAHQAACALAVAHEAGIIHRDIKPENILLGRGGVVKLVDLGIAKQLHEDSSLTQVGMTLGTPRYMSPEQIEGKKDIDGRTDIYSLGLTLFQLVTGRLTFEAATPVALMMAHLGEERPDPRAVQPELSEGTSRLISRMIACSRDQRVPSCRELERQVATLLEAREGAAPPTTGVGHDISPRQPTGAGLAELVPPDETAPPAEATPARRPAGTSNTSPTSFDPTASRRLEELLARVIGPLAGTLVRRTARTASGFEDLCRKLAEYIPGQPARQAFLSAALAQSTGSGVSAARSDAGASVEPAQPAPPDPGND